MDTRKESIDQLLLAVGEARAAKLVGLSPRTLWGLRASGKGPQYRRVGRRVIYAIKDLEAWLSDRGEAR